MSEPVTLLGGLQSKIEGVYRSKTEWMKIGYQRIYSLCIRGLSYQKIVFYSMRKEEDLA
jgi:hypothetical protein